MKKLSLALGLCLMQSFNLSADVTVVSINGTSITASFKSPCPGTSVVVDATRAPEGYRTASQFLIYVGYKLSEGFFSGAYVLAPNFAGMTQACIPGAPFDQAIFVTVAPVMIPELFMLR